MIAEPMEVFKKLLERDGDELILKGMDLKKGTYVKVDRSRGSFDIFDVTEKDEDKINPLYEEFCKLDYLSSLVDMQKPVDSKKMIHSNNYMSFFIKKDSLKPVDEGGKGEEHILNRIEAYYDTIQQMVPKDSKKKSDLEILEMYDSLGDKLLDINEEDLISNKEWIKSNLFKLVEHPEYKDNKDYLKIFFDDTIERYENENKRYVIPRIYNKNIYNMYIDGVLYGVPNKNFVLNEQKPSLCMKSRIVEYPTMLTLDDALLNKKFYDYLMNFATKNVRYVYVDDNGFYEKLDSMEKKTFRGYMLRLKKGKEVEIHGFYPVSGLDLELRRPFTPVNVLNLDISKNDTISYEKVHDRWKFEDMIDRILFYNILRNNYFTDAKDLKISNENLKRIIIQLRNVIFDWFYNGKDTRAYKLIDKNFVEIIKCSLLQGNFNKAKEQYNILCSLEKYFNMEENTMADVLKNVKNELKEKVGMKDTSTIDTDLEYYFSVGQISKYLLNLKNSKSVKQSEINAILNCKTNDKLAIEVEKLYKRYNHSIFLNQARFNNLYAMILAYEPENNHVDGKAVLGGFLSSSVLWKDDVSTNNIEKN